LLQRSLEGEAMALCDQVVRVGSIDQTEENMLRARVYAEFREMPGLRITLPQAAKLFSIDSVRCQTVLGSLVERGELSTDGRVFLRAGTGRQHQ
jgi:hypothetical protein